MALDKCLTHADRRRVKKAQRAGPVGVLQQFTLHPRTIYNPCTYTSCQTKTIQLRYRENRAIPYSRLQNYVALNFVRFFLDHSSCVGVDQIKTTLRCVFDYVRIIINF